MPKQGITVAIRARPTATFAQDQIAIDQERKSIVITNKGSSNGHGKSGDSVLDNRRSRWDFTFDHILFNASQETVFSTCGADIVDAALDGVNGTIMAYGQTGAGKTFSMVGDTSNFKHRGVMPRILSKIFETVEERAETIFNVSCTYMEIYNERIYDLLEEISDDDRQRKKFSIVEDKAGHGTFVRGLRREVIKSEEEGLNLLFEGELQRTTAKHLLNKRSNRSHCIFTIYIEQRSNLRGAENIRCSKINLVDLAGSERLKKTMGQDGSALDDSTTMRESNFINRSLTYLEQCIVALTSKSRTHVPYRQTKLTNVLKDSLGGNCKTVMLACIWAETRQIEETISTLQLASRMKRVQNTAEVNVKMDEGMLLKKYERQIKELKTELMMHDALAERSGMDYDDLTPEKETEISELVNRYIRASPAEEDGIITIESVRQIKSIFRHFKKAVKEATARAALARPLTSKSPHASSSSKGDDDAVKTHDGAKKDEIDSETPQTDEVATSVGEKVEGAGFSLGEASSDARPDRMDMGSWGSKKQDSPVASKKVSVDDTSARSPKLDTDDKERSFVAFKLGPGHELSESINAVVTTIREKKVAMSRQRDLVSEFSRRINRRQSDLDSKMSARKEASSAEADDIIDEEEYRILKEVRDLKRSYREAAASYKKLRAEVLELKEQKTNDKKRLIDSFNIWYMNQRKSTDDVDKLDYGEQFEQLETNRIMESDPDSLAFFKANRTMRSTRRSKKAALRNTLQKKRL